MQSLPDVGLHSIELFSGVGMLGEGLRAGLAHMGVAYRTVCHVEREAHGAGVLAARMEEGSMDAAPIWSDVCTFDAGAWHGRVDCIVAGFPCQDLSVAGRRAGLDGKRSGLFFEVVRIATDSGAWLMLLENVAGIASATASVVDEAEGELDERAAARVVGELADLGWDAEWVTLSASDVGASHGRARWFCLAWRVGHTRLQHLELQQRRVRAEHPGTGGAVADSSATGRGLAPRCDQPGFGCLEEQGRPRRGERSGDALGRSEIVGSGLADAQSARPQRGGHSRDAPGWQEPDGHAGLASRGIFAPGPADTRWAGIIAEHPELAPALEPGFRCVVDGLAFDMGDSRAARLKCVGNGVVAACAATAVVILARRAGLFAARPALKATA